MTTIYEQAKDLHVRALTYHYKAADGYLYEEAAYTNKVKKAMVVDAFEKGVLMIDAGSGAYYRPFGMTVSTEYATVHFAVPDTTTATTAVMKTARSE